MSEAMMPMSTDVLYYRTLLFELDEPVIMTADTFDEVQTYINLMNSAI